VTFQFLGVYLVAWLKFFSSTECWQRMDDANTTDEKKNESIVLASLREDLKENLWPKLNNVIYASYLATVRILRLLSDIL
jgi:hypothetical protein